MAFTKEQITRAWKSTGGRCSLTKRRLRLKDYGKKWEIDHSKPRAKGGTDHGNNLKPALVSANRSKQARSSRSVRRSNGLSRSPMSPAERQRKRNSNAVTGAAAGALAGGAVAGPPGAILGLAVGALLGNSLKVE